MFLSLSLANLLLYCAQELGVALGLGATTILLVAYLQAMRDGVIDDEEAQFARAVRAVIGLALWIIFISGACIAALDFTTGNAPIVFEPAYLFKWALILFILLLNVFAGAVPQNLLEGLRGGTWYALFVVHILAPVTSWINLLTLYAVWMVGFNLVWMALLPLTHEHKKKAAAAPAAMPPAPKPVQPSAPPAPKVEAPKAPAPPAPPQPPAPASLPIVQPLEIDKPAQFIPPKQPAPQAAPKPAAAPVPQAPLKPSTPPTFKAPLEAPPPGPEQPPNPWLPAVKVMPKSPEQMPPQK